MGKEVGIFRFVRAVAVAGAVLLVVGCTGGVSEPTPTPVVVATPAVVSASPSPSMSHEEQMLALIPEDAKGDDLLAAEAMAKFFISLHPGLYRGDDPALWEFLCLPESVFCSSTLESVESRLAEGETQVGGEIAISEGLADLVLDLDSDPETALIGFTLTQSSIQIVNLAGETLRTQEERQYRAAFAFHHVDGIWRVSAVEIT